MSQRRHGEPLPLGDAEFPYSKGLMARALIAVGIPADRSYHLAQRIELDLAERGERSEDVERLLVLAREVLGDEEGDRAVTRLRRLSDLQALDVPIIVLITFLIGCITSAQRLGDLAVDVADGLQDGLAAPPGPAVAELDRFVDAGRGAGRDDRAAERAGSEPHIDLDRRIAPRVDDLASAHLSDLHVAPSPLAVS